MSPEAVLTAVWLIGAVLIGALGWLIALLYEQVLERRWRVRHHSLPHKGPRRQ